MDGRALTPETLGAWLVKASGAAASTRAHLATGFADVQTRCVRPTYRIALVEAGQPLLLWVSGTERDHPAGIYARGRTTGPVADDTMPVTLTSLEHPVLRTELLGHPVLAGMEVLKMPAGGNPSYVTPGQLAVLRELSPELSAELGEEPA